MSLRLFASVFLVSIVAIATSGCDSAPGKPTPGLSEEMIRPDQVTDFNTLYSQNCAACHGIQGKSGAAIPLANPLYLSFAGAPNLQRITAKGVPGTMMPGFAKSAGGMLTDQQITIITQDMIKVWGNGTSVEDHAIPAYAASMAGNSTQGQKAFGSYCAKCHGADDDGSENKGRLGSIVDPAYLSLISDQALRTIVITGRPELGMPDYRSYPGHVLTDQEVTDIVAWLGSHRIDAPGQIYRQHP